MVWTTWIDQLMEIRQQDETKEAGRLSPVPNHPIYQWGANAMVHNRKKNFKFSTQQLRFLELYFFGLSMKAAARAAGYRGSSDQALCNTGGAILRRAVATDARVAQLLMDMAVHSQSESGRLKGLNILVKAMFPRR